MRGVSARALGSSQVSDWYGPQSLRVPSWPLPTVPTGMTLWLKADAITGKNDGDTLTTWLDSSSYANTATASGSPTYQTNEINGRPAVEFSSAYFDISGVSAIETGQTIFAVVKQTSNSGGQTIAAATLDNGPLQLAMSSGRALVNKMNVEVISEHSTAIGSGTWVLVTMVFSQSADTCELRYNGASSETDTYTGSLTTSPATMRIGRHADNKESWNGLIAEIIKYPTALASGDVARAESYLKAKYAL